MTYSDQIKSAERTYQKLRDFVRQVRADRVLIDSLRAQATRLEPLFPIIETNRGGFDR